MNCPCGRPLHYTDPKNQKMVEGQIRDLGETIKVTLMDNGAWQVPRHYIALHGLTAAELPALAEKYGWEKVE